MITCLSESNWVEMSAISLPTYFLRCFLHYFRTGAPGRINSSLQRCSNTSLLQEASNAEQNIGNFWNSDGICLTILAWTQLLHFQLTLISWLDSTLWTGNYLPNTTKVEADAEPHQNIEWKYLIIETKLKSVHTDDSELWKPPRLHMTRRGLRKQTPAQRQAAVRKIGFALKGP